MHKEFDLHDADTEESGKILDQLGVELLPFVQLIDDKGDVYWQKSGNVTLTEIINNEAQRGTRTSSEPS